MYIRIIIVSLIISSIVSWGYNFLYAPKYAQVDIFSIVNDEQKRIVELMSKGKLDKEDMEKRIKVFLGNIEDVLKQVGKEEGVIIFQKGIILSKSPDLTEKVKIKLSYYNNYEDSNKR